MRARLDLVLEKIQDAHIKEALENLSDFFRGQPFIEPEWQFFEKEYTGAVTDDLIRHTLGGVPKDVLVTSTIGAGSVTFKYADFTKDFLVVSTSGAVKVRFFAGTYVKGA